MVTYGKGVASNTFVKVTKVLNKRTNVYSYIISDLDVLFHIIIPFFSNLQFKTRKLIDFDLRITAIKLHIFGYYLTPEGLLKISTNSNKARYDNKVARIVAKDSIKLSSLSNKGSSKIL